MITRCAVLLLLVFVAAACKSSNKKPDPDPVADDAATAPASDAKSATADRSPIYIDPSTLDFAHNPALLARLMVSPYGYFRFTNIQFSRAVCERFAGKLRGMPTVNLHGDAHLENYAITTVGRGLTDFDDSSAGPALIDLLRFGVSIDVACREKGWEKHRPALIESFLNGYRDALTDPNVEVPVPALVERIRKKFTNSRQEFLAFADSLMKPVSIEERSSFEPGYERYSALMLSEHPELSKDFFAIENIGRISVGFGSALDKKFLIRVHGKTDDPEDDVVLEAKEVRDLSGIKCINSRESGGAFRILVGQARIAEVPHQFLAQVPQGADTSAKPFWVHAWHEHYVELSLSDELSPEDLKQVAYDVGVQLGRGHVRQIASPLDSQLRKAQLDMLASFDTQIRTAISELASETLLGWEQFKADAKRLNLVPE